MANTFKLRILTPSKVEVDEEVEKVFTETTTGKIQFLSNYAPSIMSTKTCITEYVVNGEKKALFTANGVINLKNNELILCCDAAENPDEIDLNRAEEAMQRAENRLKDSSKIDIARAKAALVRAMVRIDVKKYND